LKNAEVSPNMSQNNHDSAHAFIVRIWTDEQDEQGQPVAWHGSIDHVGKGTRLYFLRLESIVQFVREHTGIKTQRGVSWVGWLRTRLKAVISDSH
jgi:hypothetical protein